MGEALVISSDDLWFGSSAVLPGPASVTSDRPQLNSTMADGGQYGDKQLKASLASQSCGGPRYPFSRLFQYPSHTLVHTTQAAALHTSTSMRIEEATRLLCSSRLRGPRGCDGKVSALRYAPRE